MFFQEKKSAIVANILIRQNDVTLWQEFRLDKAFFNESPGEAVRPNPFLQNR